MKYNKVVSIEELWRFFNLSESLFCIAGIDGYFSHINPSFTNLFGFSEEEFVSNPFVNFVHPDDRESALLKIDEIRKGRTVSNFINKCLTKNGSYKWVSWTAILPDNRGDIYMVGQDCTEKMNLQEQLLDERLTKERSVMQATLYGQELEKIELGKELHDSINQMLGAAKLYLELALTEEPGREYIIKGRDIIVDSIEEIRGLTKALVGPNEREISLIESIQDLIDTFLHRKKLHIKFHTEGISESLAPNLKLMLFRIVQEQLTNIQKHAQADNIGITIKLAGGKIRLCIKDDGVGFDPATKKKGIGLGNITSRTKLYDGLVKINSGPGKGCKLTVTIPESKELPG
jgi:two-component system, NarL family, sensor histidine kinase UhpB